MEQKTNKVICICTNNELRQGFGIETRKTINDVNSFNNSNKNIQETITYFKTKNISRKKI